MKEAPAAQNSGQNNSGKPKKRGRIENLKPFKKGQSGNPGGRPKKALLTEVVEEMLNQKLQDPEAREQFKAAMWGKLLSGKVVGSMTLDSVWERTEGKVAQPVRVSGELTVSLADEMRKARERAKKAAE